MCELPWEYDDVMCSLMNIKWNYSQLHTIARICAPIEFSYFLENFLARWWHLTSKVSRPRCNFAPLENRPAVAYDREFSSVPNIIRNISTQNPRPSFSESLNSHSNIIVVIPFFRWKFFPLLNFFISFSPSSFGLLKRSSWYFKE